MIELPVVLENESLQDYIKRLLKDNIITASQITLAIINYNKKN